MLLMVHICFTQVNPIYSKYFFKLCFQVYISYAQSFCMCICHYTFIVCSKGNSVKTSESIFTRRTFQMKKEKKKSNIAPTSDNSDDQSFP